MKPPLPALVAALAAACAPRADLPPDPPPLPDPPAERVLADGPAPGPLVIATDAPPAPIPPRGTGCGLTLAQAPRAGCVQLPVLVATADRNAKDAAAASDTDRCTIWNAGGFAPASVTLDLGAETRIDVIALVPEMTPDGRVSHAIAFSDDGKTFVTGQRVEAPMQSGVAAELALPKPERARFVRVTTSASPSWVAWREIGLFRCGT